MAMRPRLAAATGARDASGVPLGATLPGAAVPGASVTVAVRPERIRPHAASEGMAGLLSWDAAPATAFPG